MKVPKAFIPEQDLEKKVNEFLGDKIDALSENDPNKEYLLILTRNLDNKSNLYCWKPSLGKPHLLKKFDSLASSLCLFKEQIYLGMYEGAILELPGEQRVAKRSSAVSALCVHNDRLYDAGSYVGIFETLADKSVGIRPATTKSLYSYNGVLYDSGIYSHVYDTLNSKEVFSYKSNVTALYCDGKDFYGGSHDCIFNLDSQSILTKRYGLVNVIGEYDGRVYDGGHYLSVFVDFSDDALFDLEKGEVCVMDIAKVPLKMLAPLVEKLV